MRKSADAYDPRRDDTASKIVVNHEEIVKYGDTSVLDVLKRVPGVTVSGANGRGGEIQMRGLGNGYTQILINGERAPIGEQQPGRAGLPGQPEPEARARARRRHLVRALLGRGRAAVGQYLDAAHRRQHPQHDRVRRRALGVAADERREAANQTAYETVRRDLDLYALWKFSPKTQLRLAASNILSQDYITERSYVDAEGELRSRSIFPGVANLRATLEMKF